MDLGKVPNCLEILLLFGLAAAVSGCAPVAPYYGPKDKGSIGYSDERLGENRYRVTYTGSSSTRRETVENFLLVRAAEVTLAAGFPYFMFDARDTKARTTYYTTFEGWPGWHGYGWYWHNWPGDYDNIERTRYEAYAEIVMLKAEEAKTEPTSINASDIISRLKPPPPIK